MGGLRDRLRNRGRGGPRSTGGGGRTPFYSKGKSKGTHTFRLGYFPDEDGEDTFLFEYYQHGWRNSTVCPKTFDENAYCEECEEVDNLYAADANDEASNKRAKKQTWLLAVPVMPGMEANFNILELPHGAANKLLTALAMRGGWSNPEPDWDDDEFIDCIEAGAAKCAVGGKGYDIIMDYDPRARDKRNCYAFKTSSRVAKAVNVEETPPALHEIFRRVKRLDREEEAATRPVKRKPKAPGKKKASKKKKTTKKRK